MTALEEILPGAALRGILPSALVTVVNTTLAKELVNIEVGGRHLDVIVATSTMAVAHAMEATSTIPIVIGLSADPLGAGLVEVAGIRPDDGITKSSASGRAVPRRSWLPRERRLTGRV
jgi:hypothetical protein